MGERPLVLITLSYVASIVSYRLWEVPPHLVFLPLAAATLIRVVRNLRWSGCEKVTRLPTGEESEVEALEAQLPPNGTETSKEEAVSSPNKLASLVLAALVVIVAISLWEMRPYGPAPDDVSRQIPRDRKGTPVECAVIGRVVSDRRDLDDRQIQFDLDAHQIVYRLRVTPVTGKVRVSAPQSFSVTYGDHVRLVAVLREPRDSSNPREFSHRRYAAAQQIYCSASIEDPRNIAPVGKPSRLDIGGISVAIRHWTLKLFEETMPHPYATLAGKLMCSIVYGIGASPLPKVIQEPFRKAGVMHILVASGTQVAVIVSFVLLLGRCIAAPVLLQTLILIPLIFVYTMVAGAQPSIVRAAVMGLVLVSALLGRRDNDPWTTLSVAALIILMLNPLDLFSIGFQLSFAAVVGLLAIAPLLMPCLGFMPRWLAMTAALTVSAQIMVLPLLAYHFGRISLIGFVSNLLVVPMAGILTTTGLLTCLAGLLHPALAHAMNFLNYHIVLELFRVTRFFGDLPFATVPVSMPHVHTVAAYYVLVFLAVAALRPQVRARWRWEKVIVLSLAALTLWISYRTLVHFNRQLTVTFLDVGEGESIVIRSPSGRTILVDGGSQGDRGEDVGQRILLPYLLSSGVTHLGAIIMSHPHADHINGLPSVLRELPVAMVLDSGQRSEDRSYEEIVQLCEEKHVPLKTIRRGAVLDLGRGARMFAMLPAQPLLQGTHADLNNNSIVLKLCYGDVSFLLVGDAQQEAEGRMLRHGDRIRSTVLKVGHQGSANATSQPFLKAVRPEVAVISAGVANPFGHPGPQTLDRLRSCGARILRTDVSGAITIRTNGINYRVETFK